nr:thioredoxin family protein [uncultured Draconibacterium sp.]
MNVLKTIGLVVLALIINSSLKAQESNINFVHDVAWKKVLKMAKKENKPIFVDAYTTWCGPCKMLAKEVFTQKDVADFFNETFINVKMDMEKGEGIELKKTWGITAFPTLLYFNEKGEIIHRIVGAHPADRFLNYSHLAIDENLNMVALQRRYDAGERNGKFLYNYLSSLRLANNPKQEIKVTSDYFDSLSNEELLKAENWLFVRDFLKETWSKQFQYVVENRDQLAKVVDKREVEESLFYTMKKQIEQWSYIYDEEKFDSEKEASLITFLQKSNYDRAYKLLPSALANKYRRTGDKEQYLNTIDYILKFNLEETPSVILRYATDIIRDYEGEVAIAKAITWLEIADAKESRIEYKSSILNAKSEAYNKLGNKSEAEIANLAAQEADKEAEKNGTKIRSVPAVKMIIPKKQDNK